jgi:NADPH:quinone reductase-like Zn-dependent oxidoreductase
MGTTSTVHDASQDQSQPAMMAWRAHDFGPPETMRFERVPVPDSVPGEILVGWIRAGLFDQANKAGQTVVIHGAAGNVGAYAVQIAPKGKIVLTVDTQ